MNGNIIMKMECYNKKGVFSGINQRVCGNGGIKMVKKEEKKNIPTAEKMGWSNNSTLMGY